MSDIETAPPAQADGDDNGELRLTPREWHVLLERRSFLQRGDNRLTPRRFHGRAVRIVPDDTFR